ncbi:ester cyclase [Elioraea sp.]|uniref:ester cyclase n=1 Tax=Elioraea sp. TaxID=2185103 RepID=UPI0025C34B71|nr:nuclear transport factor 2 family protein [Elioraea sp.]
MASITDTARAFFDAVETGQGWKAVSVHCTPDATFSAQAEPLADMTTLAAYADWMKGLLTFMPDARYELRAFATDAERDSVVGYAVFVGTHSGDGGPCPPTGKSTRTDYVYVMQFAGGKIRHMTKIWNAGWAMRELGWA